MRLGVSKTSPRFSDSLEGLTGLSIIIVMAKIYHDERTQSTISKLREKAHREKSRRELVQVFKSPLSVES